MGKARGKGVWSELITWLKNICKLLDPDLLVVCYTHWNEVRISTLQEDNQFKVMKNLLNNT